MKTDIFEDMKDCIGCHDVSDLPYHKREVWEEIKRQLPLDYPKEQLEKFSHYVFGVDYAVIMGILDMQILLERYAYSEIGGTFILI
ncbi:hypothetical protein [Mediterraneibacter gnavus]|uniref:hypothetical protein n=1 Tax=Mediterraneibacter gnavus TaxID=33038 RepID=UPI0036D254C6